MNNSSKKRYNNPFEFCDKCGCKLDFVKVNVRKINHGRFDVYTFVSKCPKCGKEVKQDRIKALLKEGTES